ncbi:hypothetical protein E2562_001951 [Oryza meyeriana var. granulata]|uniref:F-box domain-containing protein n=1 Tax=Oryza meyeriana var. granulata TaxID=110450 RepID=A0A6G1C2H5_9ORYZ|nr:hypothetical protein E2562_001951 [Oryza meyeriana var. granulata]
MSSGRVKIGDLPDDLLQHVVSLLSARQAVQTSVRTRTRHMCPRRRARCARHVARGVSSGARYTRHAGESSWNPTPHAPGRDPVKENGGDGLP